ncbi:1650_t:CDS:1, partial [Funneliformis caledonium]
SSNLFILAFWMIHIHPEVKVRLLEEIKSIFGNLLNRRITNEDLDNLKYLDAVIKETNRIQPIVPVSGRDLSTSSDTIAGYKFDSRASFFINNLYIHRHEDYWREPNKFMPERFLNDKIVKNSYVPFGGGIRICPGKLSAMTQIKTLLILFLMKYNVELVDKETPLQRIYAGLNLYPCLM